MSITLQEMDLSGNVLGLLGTAALSAFLAAIGQHQGRSFLRVLKFANTKLDMLPFLQAITRIASPTLEILGTNNHD
jgi:hypothetical protein